MKLFGVGMMKTGTSTLGFCMTALGYHHAPYTPILLRQALRGDYSQLDDYIAQYDSFDDHPWPTLYWWVDQHYPDSQFVLTVRKDSQTWYRSLCQHARRQGPTVERKLVYGYAMPQGHPADHIARYEAHNQAVLNYFQDRPAKLLLACWETGTGWPELCAFLGQPLINKPFPHANASNGRSINWRRWGRNLVKYFFVYSLRTRLVQSSEIEPI